MWSEKGKVTVVLENYFLLGVKKDKKRGIADAELSAIGC